MCGHGPLLLAPEVPAGGLLTTTAATAARISPDGSGAFAFKLFDRLAFLALHPPHGLPPGVNNK